MAGEIEYEGSRYIAFNKDATLLKKLKALTKFTGGMEAGAICFWDDGRAGGCISNNGTAVEGNSGDRTKNILFVSGDWILKDPNGVLRVVKHRDLPLYNVKVQVY